jgi:hypothetical protein
MSDISMLLWHIWQQQLGVQGTSRHFDIQRSTQQALQADEPRQLLYRPGKLVAADLALATV